MKKLLLLLTLVISLVFCFTASTMAAAETANVYVDTMIGGAVDDPFYGDGDAHETYIGFELPLDQFKLDFELQTGKWDLDRNENDDFDGFEIKGGYQLLNDRDLQLYATLSDFYRKFDSDQEFSGILVGVDVVSNLTQKVNVQGSLGVSLTGKFKQNGPDSDASLLHFKAKLNYLITKEVSASLGYRYYGFDLDNLDQEVKSKGLTLGVNFKF